MVTNGPGKYDDLATYVREQAEAKAVIVLVLRGNRGTGFSAQGEGHDPTSYLPTLLRKMADDIDGGAS